MTQNTTRINVEKKEDSGKTIKEALNELRNTINSNRTDGYSTSSDLQLREISTTNALLQRTNSLLDKVISANQANNGYVEKLKSNANNTDQSNFTGRSQRTVLGSSSDDSYQDKVVDLLGQIAKAINPNKSGSGNENATKGKKEKASKSDQEKLDKIRGILNKAGQIGTLLAIAKQIWGALKQSWNVLKGAWAEFKDSLGELWDGAVESAKEAWNNGVDWVKGKWNGAVDSIKGFWNDSINFVKDKWSTVIGSIKGFWDNSVDWVKDKWDGAVDKVTNVAKSGLSAISHGWNKLLNRSEKKAEDTTCPNCGTVFKPNGSISQKGSIKSDNYQYDISNGRYTINGRDISSSQLHKAVQAEYKEWSSGSGKYSREANKDLYDRIYNDLKKNRGQLMADTMTDELYKSALEKKYESNVRSLMQQNNSTSYNQIDSNLTMPNTLGEDYGSSSAIVNGIQAVAMKDLGLSGSIASTNSKPYIASNNADNLKILDSSLASWGYETVYTSAMGGGHRVSPRGHSAGQKVDLQLKKDGKPTRMTPEQEKALISAGFAGSGTGALGWEPVAGQIMGGHYDYSIGGGPKGSASAPANEAADLPTSNADESAGNTMDFKTEDNSLGSAASGESVKMESDTSILESNTSKGGIETGKLEELIAVQRETAELQKKQLNVMHEQLDKKDSSNVMVNNSSNNNNNVKISSNMTSNK